MKVKPLLSLVFLLTVLMAHAAELPWFDINCNLRKADYVLEGKIIDDKGKIEITHDYSQIKLNEKVIQIDQFASADNFEISDIDSSLVGRSIVIFVKKDTLKREFFPVAPYWELSTLWIDEEVYKGVIQVSNPGNWQLATQYKSRMGFEIALKNWDFLSQAFTHFRSYEKSENRAHYLFSIFKWSPFKAEIIREMKKEKEIAPQWLKVMAWDLLRQRLPTKEEICPCSWGYKGWNENIYLELFLTYKELTSNDEDPFALFIGNIKHSLSGMLKDYWSPKIINEEFIIEFIKFMNSNPIDTWETEKVILREIATTNASHYSEVFAKKLTEILK